MHDGLIEELPLPDGSRLTVRHAVPEDAEGIALLYGALSDEDRYRRFFSHVRVHRSLAERWLAIARAGGVALVVVEHAPVERIVAEAGYAPLGPGEGELAMTIAPERRGWLGPYLLDVLVREAADRGVRALEADVLIENRRMLGLLRHRGAVTVGEDGFPVVRLRIGTGEGRAPWPAPPPAGPHDDAEPGGTATVAARPHVLVEGSSMRWHGTGALQDAGFEVLQCSGPGPGHHGRCPLEDGRPCPLAEGADAIVVAVPPGTPRRERLLVGHRTLHPRATLVVEAGPGHGPGPGRGPGPDVGSAAAAPTDGLPACPAGTVAARLLAALPGVLAALADEPDPPDGSDDPAGPSPAGDATGAT